MHLILSPKPAVIMNVCALSCTHCRNLLLWVKLHNFSNITDYLSYEKSHVEPMKATSQGNNVYVLCASQFYPLLETWFQVSKEETSQKNSSNLSKPINPSHMQQQAVVSALSEKHSSIISLNETTVFSLNARHISDAAAVLTWAYQKSHKFIDDHVRRGFVALIRSMTITTWSLWLERSVTETYSKATGTQLFACDYRMWRMVRPQTILCYTKAILILYYREIMMWCGCVQGNYPY